MIYTEVLYLAIFSFKIPRLWLDRYSLPGKLSITQQEAAIGPFSQARDAAQREEEEERADPNLRKVTIERRKKGLCSSNKMDFYET